jgi:hypothetical protein
VRVRSGTAAAIIAAAAFVSSCSGSSGPSGSTTPGASSTPTIAVPGLINPSAPVPAAFLRRAETYCGTVLSAVARVNAPAVDPKHLDAKALAKLATYLDAIVAIHRPMAGAFAALGAPSAGAAQWSAYTAAVSGYVAAQEQQDAAAKTGQPGAFFSASRGLLSQKARVLEAATAAGFGAGTACSRIF